MLSPSASEGTPLGGVPVGDASPQRRDTLRSEDSHQVEMEGDLSGEISMGPSQRLALPVNPRTPTLIERIRAFVSNIEFIKTFALSPSIDWKSVVVERRWFGFAYTRDDVESEFRRFVARDMNPLIIAGVWFGGSILFALILDFGSLWWYQPCVTTPLMAVFLLVDLFYFVWNHELTPDIAKRRELLLLGIAFVALYAVSFPAQNLYERCDGFVEWFGYIFSKFPEPLTPERKRLYCRDIVNPFTTLGVSLGVPALRLRPHHHIALIMMWFIATMSGFAILAVRPASSAIGIKGAWYALFGVGSAVLACLREWLLRAQFELAVTVTQCSLSAQARQAEVDTLLCATLPASALARVMKQEPVADSVASATVIFSDIVQFTKWSSTRTASQVVQMLNALCIEFDTISTSLRVEKVKTIGDAYWAAAGVPEWFPSHAQAVCEMGLRMLDTVARLNVEHPEWGGINLRIGAHSGPLAAGMPGTQRLSYEVFGPTSHIAEEVEQAGRAKRVAVSETTRRLIGDDYVAEEFDTLHLEGSEGGSLALYLIDRPLAPVSVRLVDGAMGASLLGSIDSTAPRRLSVGVPDRAGQQSLRPQMSPSSFSDAESMASHCSTAQIAAQTRDRARFLRSRKVERARANSAWDARPVDRNQLAGGEARESAPGAPRNDNENAGGGGKVQALDDGTGEALAEKMKQRRFGYFLLTFLDAEQEERYLLFAEERNRSLRIGSRAVQLVLMLWIIGSQYAQGVGISSGAPMGLIVTSIFLWAGATLEVVFVDRLWFLENAALFMSATLCIVGCGVTTEGIAVNDVCYLSALFLAAFAFGIVRIPAVVQGLLGVLFVLVPAFIVNLRAYAYFLNFMFYVVLQLISVLITYTNERFMRQQFLEEAVATYLRRVIEEQHAAQREVLLSIVPEHIVASLVQWFVGGLQVDRSIALHYRHVAVCFVKVEVVQAPHTNQPQQQSSESLPQFVSHVAATAAAVAAALPSSPNVFMKDELPGLVVSDTSGAFGVALLSQGSGPQSQQQQQTSAADAHMAHLLHMHALIDRIAASFPAVDKIKTIGDLVMFAGPFAAASGSDHNAATHGGEENDDDSEPAAAPAERVADAVHASLGIFFNMTRQLHNVEMWCGVHTGDVVGAVVGTKRISFDVFGDAVNTASRTMGTSTKGILAMTTQAAAVLASFVPPKVQPAATSVATHDFSWTLGPVVQRVAKGKGLIAVNDVTLVPGSTVGAVIDDIPFGAGSGHD